MSDDENPFYIKDRKISNSPKRTRYISTWNKSEQNEKLVGYLEISQELWPSIKGGSHIRYVTKDNEFRPGGFVLKNPFTYKGNNTLMNPSVEIPGVNLEPGEIVGMRLQNYFNKQSPDYTTWIVSYDDIMKLYLKVDISTRTIVQSLENTIENINVNLKKITDYIKKMDERIKKIELKNK